MDTIATLIMLTPIIMVSILAIILYFWTQYTTDCLLYESLCSPMPARIIESSDSDINNMFDLSDVTTSGIMTQGLVA